ncbi:MAG TPA: type II toxin-antitoxin system VapB family antitoxin [Cryptosporangiaceae bacterium]|nr:type II toxin-antitoxin system VapB family antitoxin [Cryptosporangiaceae bacterium]
MRTLIDLDDEALELAAAALGTSTKRDTVNTALRMVGQREAFRRMRELVVSDPDWCGRLERVRDEAWHD